MCSAEMGKIYPQFAEIQLRMLRMRIVQYAFPVARITEIPRSPVYIVTRTLAHPTVLGNETSRVNSGRQRRGPDGGALDAAGL